MLEFIIDALLIVLIISAAMLCIAFIFYLKKILKSVDELKSEIIKLNLSLKPLIESTIELTKNLNEFTVEANSQLSTTKNIIDDFKYRFEKIKEFEEQIRLGIESNLKPFLSNIIALKNGLNAFWRKIKEN